MNNTLFYTLGAIDGHVEPQPLDGAHWQADQQAQTAYRDTGAVWVKNPATDQACRKRFERDLDELENAGLIFRHGKLIGLTESGDEQARKLAGFPTLNDAVDLLNAIYTSNARWSGGWISEPSLCGCEPLPPGRVGHARMPEGRAGMLCAFAGPLLAARLVEWRPVAGLDGVFLFRATEAGRDRAKHGDAARWFRRMKRPRSFDMPPSYTDGWHRAFTARQVATPARPNLVHHLDVIDAPPPSRVL